MKYIKDIKHIKDKGKHAVRLTHTYCSDALARSWGIMSLYL